MWTLDPEQMPLGRLVSVAGRLMAARFQSTLDRAGLSPSGWIVLKVLAEGGQPTFRDLAARCYVQPATITGVVDTLERDGLVRRERATDDRRVVRLHLTEAGAARLGATQELVDEAFAEVFGDVTPEEHDVVRPFLLRVVTRLGGPAAAPPPHAFTEEQR